MRPGPTEGQIWHHSCIKWELFNFYETVIIVISYSCLNKIYVSWHFYANCPLKFLWYQLIFSDIFQGNISVSRNFHQKQANIYFLGRRIGCIISLKIVKLVPCPGKIFRSLNNLCINICCVFSKFQLLCKSLDCGFCNHSFTRFL